jgi:hydrogenase maturation protease
VKTLILGIGNPILGDDGIGFHVAQELAKRINDENIDVMDVNTSGLGLLENVAGYDKVIIIDAIETESGDIGGIYKLGLEDLVNTVDQARWPHGMNFATAIDFGRKIAANQMPKDIVIFAIGVASVTEFTEEMTAKVTETVPKVVNLVLEEIGWVHRALLH